MQTSAKSTTERTVTRSKEQSLSPSPEMQPHPTGAGQEVLDQSPTNPLCTLVRPRKTFWARTADRCLQNDCPFLLAAWWKTILVLSQGATKAWQPPHSIHTSACAGRCKSHLPELPLQEGLSWRRASFAAQPPFERILPWKAAFIQGHPTEGSLGRLGLQFLQELPQLQDLQLWGHAKPVLAAPGGITAFPIWETGWGTEVLSAWKELEWFKAEGRLRNEFCRDQQGGTKPTHASPERAKPWASCETTLLGRLLKSHRGTGWHQFTHTECAQQLNECLAGNWGHFRHFAGNPISPRRELLLLGRSCWFPEFCFCK